MLSKELESSIEFAVEIAREARYQACCFACSKFWK